MRRQLAHSLTLSIALLGNVCPAEADIYTYHDAKGQLYFTDKPMGNAYKLVSIYRPRLTRQSTAGYDMEAYQKNKARFLPFIRHAALQHQLDAKLLQAIIDTESAFNPKAYSKTGAIGLMQLMPETARKLHIRNVWDPLQNIQGGAKYFRKMLDTFGQNIELSLAAYNAGPNAVKRAGNTIPDYPETKRYVRKVMQTYHKLKANNKET
jgi:soluble lytic murein transglycosylase-like protein